MAERQCTPADNTTSANKVSSVKSYGPAYVNILAVDAGTKTVTFQAPGSGNQNPVEVKCQWTRENLWALCPSSLDCDEQRLPEVGSSGTLYLSQALVEGNQLNVKVKWPDDLPAGQEYRPLRIWPTSIQLSGVELATGTLTRATIDLMDPNVAAPGQTLTVSDQPMTLDLSQVGFFRFLVPWASLDALQTAKATLSRTTPSPSAREKALAWAQVAAWEDALGSDAPERKEHVTAKALLKEIGR